MKNGRQDRIAETLTNSPEESEAFMKDLEENHT